MNCWICGNVGTTGEHQVKASDFRSYFGVKNRPIFIHKAGISKKLQSYNSRLVKSPALICNRCNSARTQPYDFSWEELSLYIKSNFKNLKNNEKIKISNVFKFKSKNQLLNVQLYFTKLFGCRLISEKIPIDISSFSDALINNKAHPNVYISFGWWNSKLRSLGVSSVQTVKAGEEIILAHWLYFVGKLVVHVMYANPPSNKKLLKDCWHPSNEIKFIDFTEKTV